MDHAMHCLRLIVVVLAMGFAGNGAAQPYPSKPVRMVVPFPAGGTVDVLARILAERVSSNWGQPVVVEPRPGGNTMIGTEIVLNAPADGYTWLMVAQTHAVNAAIYRDLRWDPARDFAAAGLFAKTVPYFVVPVSLPARDMREFVSLARAQPGKLNYGHSGIGSPPHLAFELFKRTAAIDVQGVPYKGNPGVMADVLAGRLSGAILSAVSTTSHAKGGKVRQLAVLDSKRTKAFPEVPTIVEAGYPEAQTASWFGVVLHSGTPREIVRRVTGEIEKAAKAPDMSERLENAGAESAFLNAEEFDALIRRDIVIWTRVVKEAGIKPE